MRSQDEPVTMGGLGARAADSQSEHTEVCWAELRYPSDNEEPKDNTDRIWEAQRVCDPVERGCFSTC